MKGWTVTPRGQNFTLWDESTNHNGYLTSKEGGNWLTFTTQEAKDGSTLFTARQDKSSDCFVIGHSSGMFLAARDSKNLDEQLVLSWLANNELTAARFVWQRVKRWG